MKNFLVLFFVLQCLFSFSQVNWMTLDQAINAQKENPKKILIDFYADWCQPCKKMEKFTYNHSIISKFINDNYYAVKFNSEGNEVVNYYGRTFNNPDFGKKRATHQFTKFMNVNMLPSTIFLDEKAMPITNINGFLTAKDLEPYLIWIANDDYKNIKTRSDWDNYQKKFKSKIKD